MVPAHAAQGAAAAPALPPALLPAGLAPAAMPSPLQVNESKPVIVRFV